MPDIAQPRTDPPSEEVVAVIGVGRIGGALCRRLAGAGYRTRAYDVRAEPADGFSGAKVVWCADPAHAALGAGTVFTALPGSPELRTVMLGAGTGDGLLDALRPGQVWVDLTSAAPDLGGELAEAAAARAVDRLEAPLGGGPAAVADGTATLYVGGDEALLQRCRHVLATFAAPSRIRHMGPAGAGYLTKLLVNVLWFGQAVAVGETLLLATRAGLDLASVHEALASSAAASSFIDNDLPALYRGDYLETFSLERCAEELESVVRYARDTGASADVAEQVSGIYRDALELFGSRDGELLGIGYLEATAGRTLRLDAPIATP